MKNANEFFGSSNEVGNYIYYKLFKRFITAGVYQMADTCKAFWLVDEILSHQIMRSVFLQPFQVWSLKRVNRKRFKLSCSDGNGKYIFAKNIPFSDFPYDSVTLWYTDKVLLLPCEY